MPDESNSNDKRSFEKDKEILSYLKHMTTLASGIILILVAFVEKVFDGPTQLWIALSAIGMLMVCVVCALISHAFLLAHMDVPRGHKTRKNADRRSAILLVIMWSTFLIAILLIVAFAAANLYLPDIP